MSTILDKYVPFVDFIAEILGKNSEVVLHDLTNLDSSVVAIRNNQITQREVGAPATNFVLQKMKENKDSNVNYITNYRGVSKRGKKVLRSSTFFIRCNNEIIGMLCVNTDDSILNTVKSNLEELLSIYGCVSNESDVEETENFTTSIKEFANETIEEATIKKGTTVDYLKAEDKIEIVEQLHEKGFFLLKGAVPELAELLSISEPTIYRYLQAVKKKSNV